MTNRKFPRNILHLRRGEYKSYININVPVKHAFKVRIAHLLQQHTCIFLEFFCSLDTLNMGLTFGKTVHFAYNLYETV